MTFKHGDLKNAEHPIVIKLDVQAQSLQFYCSNNKKRSGPKDISTGIGLENIRKRLDLAYGNDYRMNIKDDDITYKTELIINKL